MKITLKRTPEQIELIKAMASKNRAVASEAQTALAEFIGPVLAEVINNAPTLSNLFKPELNGTYTDIELALVGKEKIKVNKL